MKASDEHLKATSKRRRDQANLPKAIARGINMNFSRKRQRIYNHAHEVAQLYYEKRGYNKYRMIKVGKRWKLDGVLCANDDNFNYGDK